jgi:glycosyltransferase involved in cell wall biosynthesis
MFRKPNIVIYRHLLLQPSETFIRGQAEALEHFTPYYVGSRLVQGLPLPKERTLVVNRGGLLGKMSEISSKLGGFAPTFVRQVGNLNPALIHAHFGQDGAMALPIAGGLRVPLLVTFHGFDITVKDEHAEKSIGQWTYLRRREVLKRKVHLFVAVSEFIKEKLLEQGFPANKILVHYIGVDTKLFQPDPAIKRQPIVLFVGRLVEKKGCEYLIQAMRRVQIVMPEAELVVIGDGLLRSSLERQAKETLRCYQFLGVQLPESVRAWMNQVKVFCVPSITAMSGDSEGFGLVFAEAQAMGLPVVSFASGGIPEAVAHGKTGFLAAERDMEGLAQYILRLLEDKELWHRFSQSGQERVRSNFELHNQTRALESIYVDRVLNANV